MSIVLTTRGTPRIAFPAAPGKCDNCGKPIRIDSWQRRKLKHHFCDKACSDSFRKGKRRNTPDSLCRACRTCGVGFNVDFACKRGWFCSPRCASLHRAAPPVKCDWCGSRFNRPPANQGKKFNFCDTACSYAWQRKNNPRGKEHHQYKAVFADCARCGVRMELPKYKKFKNTKHHFCGRSCQSAFFTGRKLKPIFEAKCGWCNAHLALYPARGKRNTEFFCNFECRSRWYSKHYSGRNSPQYKGGKIAQNEYGKLWRKTSREIVERDGNACCGCGRSGVLLDAHHIVTARDLIRLNLRLLLQDKRLLITVCKRCHNRLSRAEAFPANEIGDRLREYVKSHPEYFRNDEWPTAIDRRFRKGVGIASRIFFD